MVWCDVGWISWWWKNYYVLDFEVCVGCIVEYLSVGIVGNERDWGLF